MRRRQPPPRRRERAAAAATLVGALAVPFVFFPYAHFALSNQTQGIFASSVNDPATLAGRSKPRAGRLAGNATGKTRETRGAVGSPAGGGGRRAVFFYATTPRYFCLALYNIFVQRQHYRLHDVDYVLGHNFRLKPALKSIMSSFKVSFVVLRDHSELSASLAMNKAKYRNSRNKFDAFRMREYREGGVVYADADAFPLRSFANLFVVPDDVDFAAPQTYYEPDNCFTGALMFVRPDDRAYEELRALATAQRDVPDMDLLVEHFMRRVGTGEGGGGGGMYFAGPMMQWPYYYFCLTYRTGTSRTFHGPHRFHNFTLPGKPCSRSYVMHFTAEGKPWLNAKTHAELADEVRVAVELVNEFMVKCEAGKGLHFDELAYRRTRDAIIKTQ